MGIDSRTEYTAPKRDRDGVARKILRYAFRHLGRGRAGMLRPERGQGKVAERIAAREARSENIFSPRTFALDDGSLDFERARATRRLHTPSSRARMRAAG
jgi:hypothetical protein